MAAGIYKRRHVAVPLPSPASKKLKCEDECTSACAQIFEQSSLPARIMFFEGGKWKDFFQETVSVLRAAFQARRSSVEFSLCESRYLLSFVRMLQMNLATGFCRSIAWIDSTGRSFMPSKYLEGYGSGHMLVDSIATSCSRDSCLNHQDAVSNGGSVNELETISDRAGIASHIGRSSENLLDVDMSGNSTLNALPSNSFSTAEASPESDVCSSDSLDTSSTVTSSNSTSDVTSNPCPTSIGSSVLQHSQEFPLLQDKLLSLKPSNAEFDEVKNRFLAGLSVLANHTTITGISRNCHQSTSGKVRYQAFRQQEVMSERIRGDANVKYAWYGTSKQGVSSVVLHGFGRPKTPKDGAMHGVGIYLAPENSSNVSAVYSDVDETGQQHVVLCRVIMGNMEQVPRGSVQFHPSSEEYDSGVDDLYNPRQYVVWSTHMSTHILPEYIISFKLAATWQGVIAALRGRQRLGQSSQDGCHHKECGKVKGGKTRPKVAYSPLRSPWMSIDMLFLLLKKSVSVESMNVLQQQHIDLKEGRLSSSDFISSVRLIAGDHLVSNSLRSMQKHVLGAVLLQNLLASPNCSIGNMKVA